MWSNSTPIWGLVAVDRDLTTTINVWNYYSEFLFSGFNSDAWAQVRIFDDRGALIASSEERLAPGASLSLDVGSLLPPLQDGVQQVMGIAYVRLVPVVVPEALKAKRSISTEFLMCIRDRVGNGEILHNTLGPIWRPSMSRMTSGLMFADECTWPKYLVLANNYFGPLPAVLGAGRATVKITNKRGETRVARSGRVPARGLLMFDIGRHFGDLRAFLGGASGHLELVTCNLLRKPWIWFEDPQRAGDSRYFSIEHL